MMKSDMTFRDLATYADKDPIISQFLRAYHAGAIDKEKALVGMAAMLSERCAEIEKIAIRLLNSQAVPTVIIPVESAIERGVGE
jgi:hypothetical protein